MGARSNRRDEIVEAAAQLFMQKGYTATSVRAISDAVGCTEAALYYHFKDGKRELLGAVCEVFAPDYQEILDECRDAETLGEFIMRFGAAGYKRLDTQQVERQRWMIAEFPHLSEDERLFFSNKLLGFHSGLAECLLKFVPNAHEAERAAWMILCTAIGFGQIFRSLEVEKHTDFSAPEIISMLKQALTCVYPKKTSSKA
jgi:AcrR family transcriptional regulator